MFLFLVLQQHPRSEVQHAAMNAVLTRPVGMLTSNMLYMGKI